MIEVVAFDADDTLWHNEGMFVDMQQRFAELLMHYHPAEWVRKRLYETEMRNLRHFGYGIKSFTLSMVETAIELTEGRISGREIANIVAFAREMIDSPVELLDGVPETIRELKGKYRLAVVTKGDLFDQESKLARSGLGELFDHFEVVTEKNRAAYTRVLSGLGVPQDRFVMIGNSLKSDVIPVMEIGAQAVHVPYPTTWAREMVSDSVARRYNYYEASRITEVPRIVEQLGQI